jgi:hypothetical protein
MTSLVQVLSNCIGMPVEGCPEIVPGLSKSFVSTGIELDEE